MRRIRKGFLSLLLVTLLFLAPWGNTDIWAAPVNMPGTITGNNVNLRNQAGTSGTTKLTALYKGDKVEVLEDTTVNGDIWYHVNFTRDGKTYNGWVCGLYVSVSYETPATDDYEKKLKEEGFPDSYVGALSALHKKYPEWIFEAVNTGLDWETVIAKESVNGRNLVQKSEDDSRKSTSSGAYDWMTNTWTIYDGSSWVSAHPDYIAYCMDPRNFLDETNIFQFESLSYNKNQSLKGVKSILSGTFMEKDVKDADGKTLSYAQAFLEIGEKTGVSPYHLAARVKQEQGAGKSSLISGTYGEYKGYYNYFNYGAYGTSVQTVINSGLAYAKRQGWNTRYKALSGGASLIGANYIKKGQDTLYFEKFNVVYTPLLYSHQYMGNVAAAISEGKSVAKGYTDKKQVFVFRIPVYQKMPAKAVTFANTGNPNNYIKSLTVKGQSLSPAFQPETTDYTMEVSHETSSATFSALPAASGAVVTGGGTIELKVGQNPVKISCKAKNGKVRVYKITVTRKETDKDYTLKSSKYTIKEEISGVSERTKTSDFLKSFTCKDGTVKILDAAGKEKTGSAYVGTGDKLVVYDADKKENQSYRIIIYGDVNGDGEINTADLVRFVRYQSGKVKLEGSYLKAADYDQKGDGVTQQDIMALNQYLGNG